MNSLTIQILNNECLIDTNIVYLNKKLKNDLNYRICKWDKKLKCYKMTRDNFNEFSRLTIEDMDKIGSCDIKIVNKIEKPKPKPKKNVKIETKLFENMVYQPYGKGYLLLANGSKEVGYKGSKETDYYHGGWWRDDLDGWFFRGSLIDILIDNGAKEVNKSKPVKQISKPSKSKKNVIVRESEEDCSDESEEDEYSDREEEYSDGEEEIGDETEEEEYSDEEEYSAEEDSEDEDSEEDYQIIMKGVYYRKYGKGLLVTGNIKTYKQELKDLEGIFNSRLNGYIFRNKSLDSLIEHGIKKDN